MKKLAATLIFCSVAGFISAPVWASVDTSAPPKQPRWLLGTFLRLSEREPQKLLRIAEKLFAPDRLRMVSVEARFAFEWQHRLAMVSALSAFFDPSPTMAKLATGNIRAKARQLISQALSQDPSLLVRDGAVESIRRIVRMQPGENGMWKAPLESAFLDRKNHVEGEGLFIRETILTAMREASLNPSTRMKLAAKSDKNPQVRELLRAWRTQAYDN